MSNGFEALEAMPQYYQYTLGIIVSASFGTRAATKFFGKNSSSWSRLVIHWRLGEKPAENLTFRQAHNLKVVGSNPVPKTK